MILSPPRLLHTGSIRERMKHSYAAESSCRTVWACDVSLTSNFSDHTVLYFCIHKSDLPTLCLNPNQKTSGQIDRWSEKMGIQTFGGWTDDAPHLTSMHLEKSANVNTSLWVTFESQIIVGESTLSKCVLLDKCFAFICLVPPHAWEM